MPASKAPKTGRTAPHVPTDKLRHDVKALAAMGNSADDIAEFIGITAPTLRKYYWTEIHLGRISGKMTNGKRLQEAAQKGNVTAMIWLDKTRYGVREVDDVGKKEQREAHARTAHQGTEWDGLLPSTGSDMTVQ